MRHIWEFQQLDVSETIFLRQGYRIKNFYFFVTQSINAMNQPSSALTLFDGLFVRVWKDTSKKLVLNAQIYFKFVVSIFIKNTYQAVLKL